MEIQMILKTMKTHHVRKTNEADEVAKIFIFFMMKKKHSNSDSFNDVFICKCVCVCGVLLGWSRRDAMKNPMLKEKKQEKRKKKSIVRS